MGFNESKQRGLFLKTKACIEQTRKLLTGLYLFKEENDIKIIGHAITSSNNFNYVKTDDIMSFYKRNQSNFIFKLIDDAIINLYLITDDAGKILRSSFTFCSCPFMQDVLIDSFENTNDDLILDSQTIVTKDMLLSNDLKSIFKNKCNNDVCLIDSIISLYKNPIYIRCDYDSDAATQMHPEYHLTINFIKESRFKIDKSFSFFDFVCFVLDALYGKKIEQVKQYIHL